MNMFFFLTGLYFRHSVDIISTSTFMKIEENDSADEIQFF